MSKKKSTTTYYITSQEIWPEVLKWRASSPDVETRVIGNILGEQMLKIARGVVSNHKFCGYPEHMKDDMVSDSVMKIIKNLKNIKDDYKGSVFSYMTICCFTACITYLKKHYDRINQQKKLIADALERVNGVGSLTRSTVVKQLREELARYTNEKDYKIDDE